MLARRLWRWQDVEDRWDACRLKSWVDGRLYQDCRADDFLSPVDMIAVLRERVARMPQRDFMIFGGTIASIDKALGFGGRWEIELSDPASGDSIRHAYRITNLMDEIKPEFRVPLTKEPA